MSTGHTTISYSLTFRDSEVKPGASLKVRGIYGLVRFECIVHDLETGKDYLLVHIGEDRKLIRIERLESVVTLKRSRRNKENGTTEG